MTPTAPEPHLLVIFGGTGDLSRRKLLPALYHLARQDLLGGQWRILAVGRKADFSDEDYRRLAAKALARAGHDEADREAWCETRLHYAHAGDAGDFPGLARRIEEIEREAGLPGNRTFYLAVPPSAFPGIVAGLGSAGLSRSPGWTRLVVEKPFGRDLESAVRLNGLVHEHFGEEQVYRIDHYLGKETVQNLLVFRFGNAIFEDLWNRDRVRSVTITVSEDLGVLDRAGFYEKTGALRDIVQNHLLQILALTAMEAPGAFQADAVRHEKVKVLQSIAPPAPADVIFGQYGRGVLGGEEVPAYLEEKDVAPDSRTETFVAMTLGVENWRWQGVPFHLRTGKRLPRKLTEIAVTFRRPPVCMFESMGSCRLHSNVLLITLQPEEGFSLLMDVKEPGEPLSLRRIPLDFLYREAFGALPDAYETLLLDVFTGDQTLFVHSEEVEASWRIVDPLFRSPPEVYVYPAGTWGPEAAAPTAHPDVHG